MSSKRALNHFELDKFEDIVDGDSLQQIFSYTRQRYRIPYLMVNKRWREIGQRKRRANERWRGMNFQFIEIKPNLSNYTLVNHWFSTFAAESGNLELLKWCIGMGCPYDSTIARSIGRSGSLAMLKWAIEERIINEKEEEWTYICCEMGHLDLIKGYFRDSRISYLPSYVEMAARKGRINIVKEYFHSRNVNGREILNISLNNNHIDIADWVWENLQTKPKKINITKLTIEVAKWIKLKLKTWKSIVKQILAISTQPFIDIDYSLGMVEWLIENSMPIESFEFVLSKAIGQNQSLLTLQFIKQQIPYPYRPDPSLLFNATRNQDLEYVKWVYNQCAPLDLPNKVSLSKHLESRGSIELYEWARDEGIPFDDDQAVLFALNQGNHNFVIYLIGQGFKWNPNVDYLLSYSSCLSLDNLKFATELGFSLRSVYEGQSYCGNWKTLAFAIKNGFEWNPSACFRFASNQNYGALRWVLGHSTRKERGVLELYVMLNVKQF